MESVKTRGHASVPGRNLDIEPRIKSVMMASLTPLDLAALLCSRVCHDVISPVGAIINGLEVLDGEEDEEMRVVRHGAHQKERRFRFRPPSVLQARIRRRGLVRSNDRYGRRGKSGARHFHHQPDDFAVEHPERRMASRNSVKLLLNLCLIAAERRAPRRRYRGGHFWPGQCSRR